MHIQSKESSTLLLLVETYLSNVGQNKITLPPYKMNLRCLKTNEKREIVTFDGDPTSVWFTMAAMLLLLLD